jgi:hypothetical protein
MKIKISKDVSIESSTLIRISWRHYYPVLIVHEKFEKILKWTLRIIAFVGIGTSILTIDHWYFSFGLAILIFVVERFFENTIIEYTSMLVQPLPDFEVERNQWKTNGFRIPQVKDGINLAYFGPGYADREYAIKFFTYLRSWINDNGNDDTEDNLVVSFVLEPNEQYTTYLYANPKRKRLSYQFKFLGDSNRLEKYGKKQQQFIAQMLYWNTLDFKYGSYIKMFLEFQSTSEPFYLIPCVTPLNNQPLEFLYDYSIKKYYYKLRKRKELLRHDIEYYYYPGMYGKDA